MTGVGGYDDWQGPQLWRSSAFTSGPINLAANQIIATLLERGSSFSSLALNLNVTSGGVRITLRSLRTIPDANAFQLALWNLLPGMRIVCTVPVLSTWTELVYTGQAAGPSVIETSTQRVNIGTDRPHYYGNNHEMGEMGTNVPAGGSVQFDLSRMLPGPAHVWMRGPAAGSTLRCNIDSLDLDSVRIAPLLDRNPIAGQTEHQFVIPPNYWRVLFSNSGGAAQSVSWGLAAQSSASV